MITLPKSKSISARALIIKALYGGHCDLLGLSDCEDTQVLQAALRNNPATIDVAGAGTAMRFLTAYYAMRVGEEHVLSGNARMHERPIGPLVDALRSIGADITYEGEVGYPPLRIRGRRLKGGIVRLSGSTSSQFVSALLMIAPYVERGITLMLRGRIASKPYIRMTLQMMQQFGAQCQWTAPLQIDVLPSPYQRPLPFPIEPDWTAASYWYTVVALAKDAKYTLTLKGLTPSTLQGDSNITAFFLALGVNTTYTPEGAVLSKIPPVEGGMLRYNLSENPDLAPTLIVAAIALGRKFYFAGLANLRLKETDRIAALQAELARLKVTLQEPMTGVLTYDPETDGTLPRTTSATIDAHGDHRIAMAFAPLMLRYKSLKISTPEVVSKSYPDFWQALQSVLPTPKATTRTKTADKAEEKPKRTTRKATAKTKA